tara:strand:+ start:59 stop:694 length:636 start_codon:yes stop_codon:yes gene_type:complete
MTKRLNMTVGDVFGKLTLIGEMLKGISPTGRTIKTAECLCKCGKIGNFSVYKLKSGETKSCGCGCIKKGKDNPNYKGGHCRTALYSNCSGAKNRCTNPNNKDYKNYGGRGIKMYQPWVENTSLMVEYVLTLGDKEGLQIDRIDNNGNYEPGNIRIIPSVLNCQNKSNNVVDADLVREMRISTLTPLEIAEVYNINIWTVYNILNRRCWSNI